MYKKDMSKEEINRHFVSVVKAALTDRFGGCYLDQNSLSLVLDLWENYGRILKLNREDLRKCLVETLDNNSEIFGYEIWDMYLQVMKHYRQDNK